ncbi:TOTE conflict system archaeo-eukaryotic primase domain-containing protein [Paenibacillus agaridevorans]|uniref:TOTE conflict system archaeo-eukaryotic primase domain-containing protein n=1 Tax=Paenibacillus agaridevorans TaxID=171404 RepID=UPI001BE40A1E|nr:DEAD/DEAH box helicase [Paenibacillus agaridevorans]
MDDIHEKYKAALKEINRLLQENERLKNQLERVASFESVKLSDSSNHAKEGDSGTEYESPATVHQLSSVSEKLAIYRNYFRGREDVYPVRWSNKQGKSGYSPACGNEWTSVCQKPKVKCSACLHQNFLQVTDDVLSKHLDARQDRTIGVYPMLPDETCWFLAMDFDKKNWKDDSLAVMQVCEGLNIPASLERSRSGQGGHLWIFFEEPIAASLARRLGTIILTLTMNQRYQIGLESYDRLFPNQDTLPKGGFGNLIALPLQGGPRKSGNSVFVNEKLEPYDDQWRYLASVRKLTSEEVLSFIKQHAVSDDWGTHTDPLSEQEIVPWAPDKKQNQEIIQLTLPDEVKIVLSNRIYIRKDKLPAPVINQLLRLASFSNPDFYKAQALRLSTFDKPRIISCSEDLEDSIALPRGCKEAVLSMLEELKIKPIVEDRRCEGQAIDVQFEGELTILQDAAARAITAHEMGILSAATGFGKTVVAASIIARRKVSTLIIVHRRELMEQWKERLHTFLSIEKNMIGLIGGGKDKRSGVIDIAIIQSLNRKGEVKDFIEEYGQVIVDECHHLSAFSFEQVLIKAKAKYVVGLTATLKRQDGHEAIVMMQLGPIRTKIDAKSLTSNRGFSLTVVPRYTNLRLTSDTGTSIQEVYQYLVSDEERNTMIFDDLLACLEEGRSPLLLVERREHAFYFEERLRSFARNVIVLTGGMGKKQRDAAREQITGIPDQEERVFIATGKLIGEGFDDARLDTLFLVHPISWSGTLQQYAGRLHRTHVHKNEVKIYDYIDLQVPVLMSMYKKRVKGYRKMGYKGAEL